MVEHSPSADGSDVRERILEAASRLVASGGIAALTTRAVAAAASVQAPALYRLFRDKRGLLDAVAERGLETFVSRKATAEPSADPVRDLCEAWAGYIQFGIANPAVFAIMNEVGRTGPPSPAALAGMAALRKRVERIAQVGLLRVPVPRAVSLIHAAGTGTVATLLAAPEDQRDLRLATSMLDALLAELVETTSDDRAITPATLAIGLLAHLDEADALSPGERMLMRELLTRLAESAR